MDCNKESVRGFEMKKEEFLKQYKEIKTELDMLMKNTNNARHVRIFNKAIIDLDYLFEDVANTSGQIQD